MRGGCEIPEVRNRKGTEGGLVRGGRNVSFNPNDKERAEKKRN